MLIKLDKEGRAQQMDVINAISQEEVLSQLTEECCELGQASQKMRRVLCGTTPVSEDEVRANLEEEAGDVLLMIDYIAKKDLIDLDLAMESAKWKNKRWYERTIG